MELNGLFMGLGNPGQSYSKTRHNFGFMAVDALLVACDRDGEVSKLPGGRKLYEAWKCRLPVKGRPVWIVAKPLTYMNKSGEAANTLLHYYKIPRDNLLVVHDELDLPFGRMRFKYGGGAAGHNGIRSITQVIGSSEFYRLRLGIGKPEGYDASSFVLGTFSKEEMSDAHAILSASINGFFIFCTEGFTSSQQLINSFTISR